MLIDYETLLQYNIDNIDSILTNSLFSTVLDVTNNSVCRKTKESCPDIHDDIIKAHGLTVLQLLLLEICDTDKQNDLKSRNY